MGNRASKAATATARTVKSRMPETPIDSAAASSRILPQSSSQQPVQRRSQNIGLDGKPITSASSSKSAEIRRDAADPSGMDIRQLSKNLASLGQATITDAQRHNTSRFARVGVTVLKRNWKPRIDCVDQNTQSVDVLTRRRELEATESSISPTGSSIRNRFTTSSLTTLLDARKEITTSADLRKLCNDFDCDEAVLQQLTRYVTSPSLSLQRSAQNEKEDTYLVRTFPQSDLPSS
ncbi:hypothetical protein EMMF5_001343 [Cystobasidiomycetes sp. EMM_F5]